MRSGGGSSDRGFDAIVGFAMAIHIRVVTPITTQGFRSPEDATQLECDGVKVDFVNIETGPASIECMLSQPGMIARVIEAGREGADAVVIDCMGDPGLFGARECVCIPVLRPMQTAMGIAAMMGHKFSVVTVLSRIVPMIENEAESEPRRRKAAGRHCAA
jgi:allantoin racemase